jgi:phospholipid/cholesterol/gamma-HCH transport system substrate-binding protein
MRSYGREFTVGIVFFMLLGALGVITFKVSAAQFKSMEQVTFKFDDVAGLTEGSEVWINGLPSGTVREIGIDPDGTVVATAHLHNKLDALDLTKGVNVEVKDKSTLGGSVVAITTMRKAVAAAPKSLEEIQARVWSARAGGFASVGAGAVEKLVQASEEKPAFLGKALLGEDGVKDLNESLSSLKATIKDLREWLDAADKKDSVLAVLLRDPETGRKVRETVDSIHDLTAKANGGEGLIGKLLNDPETAKRFDRIVDRVDTFTEGLKNKDGTLYKLLNDGTLFDNAKGAVDDIRKFTGGLNDEKGTLHLLVHDEKFAGDLTSTVSNAKLSFEDLRGLIADVRGGKGTLGKLLTDDTLYDDLKSTLNTLKRTFEEGRENAPILTFAGFLFRAF